MSKPATDVRLAAAANGFTEVIGRGNAHIITKNPTTGKCAFDSQVGGGWHYNGDQETDTAWEQDADQNYLKMVKAGYNLRARKLFNAGDLIQYIDPGSGQYVKFQPVNFQWIDGTTGSNSLISVAQAISAPTIDDDKLYWPAAFGTGRHFRYTASPTRLIKHLIIDSAANLPACPAWITNPWLELTFTLTPSSGVTMYVDGVAWDQAKSKTTANAIEFRLPSGQVVWQLAAPTAYDSSSSIETGQCAGQIRLYVNKKIKYCSVRFPKAWIDTAVFPITLDPSIDKSIVSDADDGYYTYANNYFDNDENTAYFGYTGQKIDAFLRFTGVSIPTGATIDVATIGFYVTAYSGTAYLDLFGEDAANPSAVTSAADGKARTRTTAYASDSVSAAGAKSVTITDVVDELLAANDYSGGAAMQFFVGGTTSGGSAQLRTYHYGSGYATLHIEYTEASTDLEPALIGGKLIFGGLTLNGLVGR